MLIGKMEMHGINNAMLCTAMQCYEYFMRVKMSFYVHKTNDGDQDQVGRIQPYSKGGVVSMHSGVLHVEGSILYIILW